MCSFFLITHQCSSGALIRPATAGMISPILRTRVCVYVCVLSMFVPGTLPKVALPPCLPNKQKKVQCFSAWTNPTFAFSCASEQAGDRCPSRSPHLGSPVFTFLVAVVLLPLDFSVLSPCQSPGASRVPSPGIKKQLKRLMHSRNKTTPKTRHVPGERGEEVGLAISELYTPAVLTPRHTRWCQTLTAF
ncbi:unnamed protein product [Leuciscus chuanchicus]